MGEYEILGSYVVLALVVFLGAVLWNKHRKAVVRKFRLSEYRHLRSNDHAAQPR